MASPSPITIIAHRGASGYLPEHTLEAKAMAHAQGADFLEQDLVLTKEDVPIVLHDIRLDTVTDVARVFPDHARPDGRYYAIDFRLAEIRRLTVSERFDPATGRAVFPNRYPPHQGRFRIPTFEEEIEFIQGLNKSTGRTAGIYPEIKQPTFHRTAGKDITRIVIEMLTKHGYTHRDDPCFVQCFETDELRLIRDGFHSDLRLIQLLEHEDWLKPTALATDVSTALRQIADYAIGIGPPLSAVFPASDTSRRNRSQLVDAAHAENLVVHPWTYRADQLPAGFETIAELHTASLAVGVDGIFTDFPDVSRKLFDDDVR